MSLVLVMARQEIRIRLNRLAAGAFSDCRPVGDGVHELKIDFGPGYPVYFGNDTDENGLPAIVLLTAGDKSSQDRDIKKAKKYWKDWNA